MSTLLTAEQTVGPFFAPELLLHKLNGVAEGEAAGDHIRVVGKVFDGDGVEIPDAMVELWQANSEGEYLTSSDTSLIGQNGFKGFGRSGTTDGGYWFETVKPGQVPHPNGGRQAPHLVLSVFSRGMINHAVTRFYFEDEASNATDPVLQAVPENRRQTMIAKKSGNTYTLDIRLQGDNETVFFDI
jgi:protocatechuate 3,4-dioxygenase alpha subunit